MFMLHLCTKLLKQTFDTIICMTDNVHPHKQTSSSEKWKIKSLCSQLCFIKQQLGFSGASKVAPWKWATFHKRCLCYCRKVALVIEWSERTDHWFLLHFIVSRSPDRGAKTGSNNKQTANNRKRRRCLYRQNKTLLAWKQIVMEKMEKDRKGRMHINSSCV